MGVLTANPTKKDSGPKVVVRMDCVPRHWDMSAMREVKMGLGLKANCGSNTNLVGRIPLQGKVLEELQQLIDASFRKVYTRDRKGGMVPDHLELSRGVRIQNAQNWMESCARTEAICAHLEKLKTEGSPGVCP